MPEEELSSTMRTSIVGRSCYFGSLARRAREAEGASDAAYLKELYHRNDTEAVIRLFESQPSLHSNPTALSEYVKALVKVDRLHESELLKTLHRGRLQFQLDQACGLKWNAAYFEHVQLAAPLCLACTGTSV